MLAAVLDGPGVVSVREVAAPAAAGRALVRVEQAGLCGTDLTIVAGEPPVPAGRVLGHEMSGRVEVAGPAGAVPAGTPVLVNPAVYCGLCPECRNDLPNLCRHGGLLGRDADGCFAELVAVPETQLHPLPDSVAAGQAALLQVLSTCVHAQSLAPAAPGDTAVVIGLGVTGLLHLQLLRARGVRTIVGITRSAGKQELARQSGATAVAAPQDAAAAVAAATGGHGAGLVIECAGAPGTLAQATELAEPGGTVIAFGITPPAAALPTYQWYYKELTIRCPRAARPRDVDTAIRLAADRRLDLGPLVTARFPLTRTADALAAAAAGGQLKVVLDVAGREAS
ncbi:MAG: alcohol dehydrogenase catalytic domain-containing protein [Actinobacteria bacterium]|nr:alcohol dehydrogenase catalytic domain-containing protein [Actinomycetota bacterium]